MFVVLEAQAFRLYERISIVLCRGLHIAAGFVDVAEAFEAICGAGVAFDQELRSRLGFVESPRLDQVDDGVGLFDEDAVFFVVGSCDAPLVKKGALSFFKGEQTRFSLFFGRVTNGTLGGLIGVQTAALVLLAAATPTGVISSKPAHRWLYLDLSDPGYGT